MSPDQSEIPNKNTGNETVLPESENSIDPRSIEGVFLLALRKDPAERAAFLAEICGDDADRLQRVTALLRAYEDAGSFLEQPASLGRKPKGELSLGFLTPTDKPGCLGTLGPYDVLDVIGHGGMGIVLRAFEPKLDRVVAIKVMLPELAAKPNARRRFLREARAAAAVVHPHVVTIHAVEESLSTDEQQPAKPPYLVMECVVGQSLQQKLDRVGPLRLEQILRISRQIAEGLAAAHKQGLIHRDIKPANILLENGVERAKITDFGLARAADDIAMTRTGELSGTPQYMSPEQASGEQVDQRSDLFSLGCVMYAMCAGQSPFYANSLAHTIKRVTQETPLPAADVNPQLPVWLSDIIDTLLQKDPDKRFQTAYELAELLDQHLAQIQQAASSRSHSRSLTREPTLSQVKPVVQQAKSMPETVPRRREKAGNFLIGTGGVAIVIGFASLIFLAVDPNVLRSIPDLNRNSEPIVVSILGVGILLLIAGALLHGNKRGATTSPLVYYILLGPLGIVLWLIARDSRERAAAMGATSVPAAAPQVNKTVELKESIHTRTGRFLLLGGAVAIVAPLLLIAVGMIIGEGDVMEWGGSMAMICIPAGVIAIVLGYILRYIIPKRF